MRRWIDAAASLHLRIHQPQRLRHYLCVLRIPTVKIIVVKFLGDVVWVQAAMVISQEPILFVKTTAVNSQVILCDLMWSSQTKMINHHVNDHRRLVIPLCVLHSLGMSCIWVDEFERLDTQRVDGEAQPQLRIN